MFMTDSQTRQAAADPRQEPFTVPLSMLTQEQLDGLVQEYCTRYHGLNETENPLAEHGKVLQALRDGRLSVWFDPVENLASVGATDPASQA